MLYLYTRDRYFNNQLHQKFHFFNFQDFSCADNASRHCLPTGEWENRTNYSMCKELCKDGDTMTEAIYKECEVEDLELDISLHVYFAGDI